MSTIGEADVVAHCSATLTAVIAPLLGGAERVALVDYPHSLNGGDHAIWLGEKAFLAARGVEVAYECGAYDYDRGAMAARIGDDPILMHGGGNFGDLYTLYNEFRLRILEDFPANPVLLFPQQSTFLANNYLNRVRARIGRHGRVTLVARDVMTHHIMTTHFGDCAQVVLAPDMAFALGPLARPAQPLYDVVWISRTDAESAHGGAAEVATGLTQEPFRLIKPRGFPDGLEMHFSGKHRAGEVLITDWYHLDMRKEVVDALNALSPDAMSRAYLSRTALLLSLGRLVITDRLHGHILALLLGIPHILLNNLMGKNWNFYDTWTRGSPRCRLATDPTHAWSLAQESLRALPSRDTPLAGWSAAPVPMLDDDFPFELAR